MQESPLGVRHYYASIKLTKSIKNRVNSSLAILLITFGSYGLLIIAVDHLTSNFIHNVAHTQSAGFSSTYRYQIARLEEVSE